MISDHANDRANFNELSTEESIRLEFNYGNLMSTIRQGKHLNLTPSQLTELTKFRQKLDNG